MFQLLISLTAIGLVLYGLTVFTPNANTPGSGVQARVEDAKSKVAKGLSTLSKKIKEGDETVSTGRGPKGKEAKNGAAASDAAKKRTGHRVRKPAEKTLRPKKEPPLQMVARNGEPPEPSIHDVLSKPGERPKERFEVIGMETAPIKHKDQHNISDVLEVNRQTAKIFIRIDSMLNDR